MDKLEKIVSKIEETLLSFSVLGMAAILIAGVIARAVFNSSLTFTEEIGQALNIAVTFLGIGYCARKARHISMSVVFDLVPEKAKKIMMCIISLLTGLIMLYLTYISIKYTISVLNLGRVTPALRIPMWIIYLTIPIGFLLGTVEYLKAFVVNIRHKGEIFVSSQVRLGENIEGVDDMPAEEKEEK